MDGRLVKENPLLLPMNRNKTVYDGFITVQDQDFRLRVLLPPDRQIKQAKVLCCWSLRNMLRGHEVVIKQRLLQSSDLGSFLLEMKTVLEVCVQNRPEPLSIPRPQSYSDLLSELETLGWDKLLFIDSDFRTLRLKADDAAGRGHVLTVKLKPKHPSEAPECTADVPLPLSFHWTPQKSYVLVKKVVLLHKDDKLLVHYSSSLSQLHAQFLLLLDSLSEFWEVLEEIDLKTWVLEPEKPSRSDTMRRIAIGNNASVKVEVDPRHPKMLPDCCLLGAEHVVTPLRNKLNANMHLWSPDLSLLSNLCDVLETQFPSPSTHDKSSLSVECGICYSFRLETRIPDQVCNDPRCGQPFHQDCLYQWLRALPSTRQSFNVVFGECPYCSQPIMVKMAPQQ